MSNDIIIKVPDIGGAKDVEVIEILVKPGDTIKADASLITLESEKASMEIPSPNTGKVQSIAIKVGDKVSEGDAILTLKSISGETCKQEKEEVQKEKTNPIQPQKTSSQIKTEESNKEVTNKGKKDIYAGPGVRRLAQEFGVDLSILPGSGRKGRIQREDLYQYIKHTQGNKQSFAPVTINVSDFEKYGSIEVKPLNKIKRLTGTNVHRSWISIPHVTQFDEADITDLEQFRQKQIQDVKLPVKLTLLAFVVKVIVAALKKYPQFNSTLDEAHGQLIFKNYFNIGIAVDTPDGLVVPVIKAVDTLSVYEIATVMVELSNKAREKKLTNTDMQGGCFTISSLGGIGGTAFTPIINSPEVAILGLSRAQLKPIYINETLKPRLMLPLSLSYDHRVIDGAEAARFLKYVVQVLDDLRTIIL